MTLQATNNHSINLVSPLFVSKSSDANDSWWEMLNSDNHTLTGNAYHIAKRVMDLTILAVAVPFLLPILLLIVILIKIESPDEAVIFMQKRTGKNGRRFAMYKFRTMVSDAEEMKKELIHLNELQWPDFKITDDPRITYMGRFLRKTSVDELPQLYNILKGDMSFVGPRPTSFAPETYSLWHTQRLDVQPGLTGLWQIIGRASTEFDDRVRLDIAYVDNSCLWLDIKIMAFTFITVLTQRGAH